MSSDLAERISVNAGITVRGSAPHILRTIVKAVAGAGNRGLVTAATKQVAMLTTAKGRVIEQCLFGEGRFEVIMDRYTARLRLRLSTTVENCAVCAG